MFKGSITALVTPFADGRVDHVALRNLIDWQIAEGSSGLLPCGTTGESPTLSHQEHKKIVEITIETAKGRVPVIAGAGSNSTAEAIDYARHAQQVGADGLLIVILYYNKPTQEGIYQHFKAIDAESRIPIVVYNIPGRSVVDIQVDTLTRIFKDCRNVKGVKDATGNLLRPSLERLACGKEFNMLTGEDGTALGYMAHGGHGCISVSANAAPRLCAEFRQPCLRGDFASALELQDRLMPLHRTLFLQTESRRPRRSELRLFRSAALSRARPIWPCSISESFDRRGRMFVERVETDLIGSVSIPNQVAFQVVSYDLTVTLAASAGSYSSMPWSR